MQFVGFRCSVFRRSFSVACWLPVTRRRISPLSVILFFFFFFFIYIIYFPSNASLSLAALSASPQSSNFPNVPVLPSPFSLLLSLLWLLPALLPPQFQLLSSYSAFPSSTVPTPLRPHYYTFPLQLYNSAPTIYTDYCTTRPRNSTQLYTTLHSLQLYTILHSLQLYTTHFAHFNSTSTTLLPRQLHTHYNPHPLQLYTLHTTPTTQLYPPPLHNSTTTLQLVTAPTPLLYTHYTTPHSTASTMTLHLDSALTTNYNLTTKLRYTPQHHFTLSLHHTALHTMHPQLYTTVSSPRDRCLAHYHRNK